MNHIELHHSTWVVYTFKFLQCDIEQVVCNNIFFHELHKKFMIVLDINLIPRINIHG